MPRGDSLTNGPQAGPMSKATIVLLAVLFVAGIIHWVLFLNSGRMSFKVHDWGKELVYYSVVRQAINTGTLPYHISVSFHGTNRFLAIPETNLSPQVFLLPLMSVGSFILFNVLFLYAVGFVGCILIMRRYRLGMLAFAVMFLILNFNGHLTAHMGVGHSMWAGYFLLPFFFLCVLEVVEGRASRRTPLKMAVVMLAIALQGAFHTYVWCLAFLLLLTVFNWRHARPLVSSIVSSVLVASFRLVPALFTLAGRKEKFYWFYPTPTDLLEALTVIRQETPDRLRPWGTPGWWEYDAFVGILGLAVIAVFGIGLRFSRRSDLERFKYPGLDLPVAAMAALSLSYFYAFLARIPLPFLRVERVATRFIIVPLVLLAIISAMRMETIVRRAGRSFKFHFLTILGLAVMALSFVDHSFLWSVARLERAFRDRAVDLTVPSIVGVEDGTYKAVLAISAIATVVSIGGLVYITSRRPRARDPA